MTHDRTDTANTPEPPSQPLTQKKSPSVWLRWTVLSLLALILVGIGYYYQKQPNTLLTKNANTKATNTATTADKTGKGGAISVTVVPSQQQNIALTQTLPATVAPLQQTIIRPTQSGQIVGIYFKDGQFVKKGQLLAKLDDRQIQTSIDSAKAVINQNQVQLATNLQTQQRYQSLIKDNAVSQQELAQAIGQTKLLQAQQATSQTQLESALVQLSNTEIKAPFSGIVGIHKVSIGSMVSPSDINGIVTLTQVSPIAVSFGIPNGLLTQAPQGLPIEVWSMADKSERIATSHISTADGQIDSNGNLPVQASVDNSDRKLTAGQPIQVKLITKQYHNIVTVPLSAVQDGLKGQFVMTAQADDSGKTIAKRQDITVIDQNDEVAIVENLPVATLVIIDGTSKIKDGATINAVTADPKNSNKKGISPKQGHNTQNTQAKSTTGNITPTLSTPSTTLSSTTISTTILTTLSKKGATS